jgi:23S rRNA pseudouridine1911/1915/1917 synthase
MAGEKVEVRLEPSAPARPTAAEPARVVWEDPLALVADKPADLLVHGDGTGAETLSDRVQAHLAAEGSRAVAQAVQRLDVETTGLVLFSKTEQFQPAFDALVAGGAMRKRYLAEVSGCFPEGDTVIERPLGRDRHDARRMRVSPTGKASLTRVTQLETRDGRSLLLVELGTGRRHQIRVHLASLGFPVVGDALYGGERSDEGLMLHAWEERFTHPVTGEKLCLRTPWPERFHGWDAPLPGN